MKWLKEWVEKHLFIVWIISSVVFAFIIHSLFSIVAPNGWLTAKWGAGDILTFVSTVSLGLLAVWQNKKFKEENDISQTRIENLTQKANELSIISKVIEYESEGIARMRTKVQEFIRICNTEAILADLEDIASQPNDFKKIYVKIKMDIRIKQISLYEIELLYELLTCPKREEIIELIDLIPEYSKASIELVKKVRVLSNFDEEYEKKAQKEGEFIKKITSFVSNREQMLKKVVFKELTLEQIRKEYGEN